MHPDKELIDRLRSLSALEDGWYANVGRKTGELCCSAMREAADRLEALSSGSVDELAMLVRMLVQHVPEDKQIKVRAVDYLARHGLAGSPLRSSEALSSGEAVAYRIVAKGAREGSLGVLVHSKEAADDYVFAYEDHYTITPLYAAPRPMPGREEVASDLAWLESLKDNGHCGEGTMERRDRYRRNDRIDRLISLFSSSLGGDLFAENAKKSASQSHPCGDAQERSHGSPNSGGGRG